MTTTMDAETRKRSRRSVLVFRGGINGKGKDFTIDEDDYRVMDQILPRNNSKYATTMDATQAVVEIREEDEERRVYKVTMPVHIEFLLEPILELDALEILVLQYPNMVELPN